MKLYNITKSLILEIASMESIVDAIKKRKKVIIYYDGDEPGGRGLREIEPVAFGYSNAGNPVVRAWDMEGSSHTGYLGKQPLPGWRLFRLDKIMSLQPTGETFDTPRPDYNFNGDKTMKTVIINAKFNQPNE
jgi:predicted DNA-binding transcriptional regulator YafY